jgi:NADPH-dependent 2,4-dienoyl-CoA reductase/sulfur reductase-like enzyme
MKTFDVAVVGAGPAGLAAASAASTHGARVCLIDDNASCGGQIWRGLGASIDHQSQPKRFHQLQTALTSGHVDLRTGTTVVALPSPGSLRIDASAGSEDIHYSRLVLATGARETFLPFPGWTLPGVTGVGALQAMVKGGLPIHGKRVVLAGSGPLLLAVAGALAKQGALILGIFEQAGITKIAGFCARLLRYPDKLREGATSRAAAFPAPYRTGSWVVHAHGDHFLQSVSVSVNGTTRTIDCDYLGCAFHLVPNLELPRLLDCEIEAGFVRVNESQETSIPNVYCAGEPTGIGGLEKALAEGEIAGLVCAGTSAKHIYGRRDRYVRFANMLDRTFALRPELKKLPGPDTFVCRCEDVPLRSLAGMRSQREAKLHTRCGMGPCQGRICGSACEFLFGWESAQIRPPILPSRISTLASPSNSTQP